MGEVDALSHHVRSISAAGALVKEGHSLEGEPQIVDEPHNCLKWAPMQICQYPPRVFVDVGRTTVFQIHLHCQGCLLCLGSFISSIVSSLDTQSNSVHSSCTATLSLRSATIVILVLLL